MGAKENQLHALLAVENDRRKLAEQILNETIVTFSKKQDHFDGVMKVYEPFEEGSSDKIPPEIKNVVTTVAEKLAYTSESVAAAIDAQISKEETNMGGEVVADLEVDGTKLGKFGATSLLAMETHLVKIRSALQEIPTLDPTKTWKQVKDADKSIYKTEEEVKYRTNKKEIPLVLAPATEKFPAQVKTVVEDTQVGTWTTTYTSGRVTPLQKSQILGRCDAMISAVKQARATANQAQVKQIKVGDSIFAYLLKGLK